MRRSRAALAVTAIFLAFGVVLLGAAWADDDARPVTMLDSGDCWPSSSGCASMVVGPDGTCVVDFPVTEQDRSELAALCPNGIESKRALGSGSSAASSDAGPTAP
jgi:hypothetical protein